VLQSDKGYYSNSCLLVTNQLFIFLKARTYQCCQLNYFIASFGYFQSSIAKKVVFSWRQVGKFKFGCYKYKKCHNFFINLKFYENLKSEITLD